MKNKKKKAEKSLKGRKYKASESLKDYKKDQKMERKKWGGNQN